MRSFEGKFNLNNGLLLVADGLSKCLQFISIVLNLCWISLDSLHGERLNFKGVVLFL